jgi:hypothetical protein
MNTKLLGFTDEQIILNIVVLFAHRSAGGPLRSDKDACCA